MAAPPDVFPSPDALLLSNTGGGGGSVWDCTAEVVRSVNSWSPPFFSLPPFCPVIHLGWLPLSTVRGLTFCLTSRPVLLQQNCGLTRAPLCLLTFFEAKSLLARLFAPFYTLDINHLNSADVLVLKQKCGSCCFVLRFSSTLEFASSHSPFTCHLEAIIQCSFLVFDGLMMWTLLQPTGLFCVSLSGWIFFFSETRAVCTFFCCEIRGKYWLKKYTQ